MVKEGYKEVYLNSIMVQLPNEWKLNIISEYSKKIKGKRPKEIVENKTEGYLPYLVTGSLSKNDFEYADPENSKICKKEDVLISWDGTVGKVFTGYEGVIGSTMSALTFKDGFNSKFGYYFLSSLENRIVDLAEGSTVPHVPKDFMSFFEIVNPPLLEQKKIVSILSSVDNSIEKTDEVIEETKELKKGLMQHLLTKGIGHSEFKEVRIGAKKIEIPKEWKVSTINDLTSKVQYGISEKMYLEGQYPIFRMNNFYMGYMIDEPMKYINLDDSEFEKYKVEMGDILFNRTNSVELVGKNGIFTLEGDYVFASYLIRLRTNDKCDSYYLNYYLNSYNASSILDSIATRGASQANINAKNLKSVDVPLPPIEEQKKIASILSSVDAKIKKEEEYKAKLERFKKGLMQKLLTGEIRVNTEMEV